MSYQRKVKCPRCFIANDEDRRICRNCNTPLRGWRRKVTVQEHSLWNLYDNSQNNPKSNSYSPTLMLKKRVNY